MTNMLGRYWAEMYLSEFGFGVAIKYGEQSGLFCDSGYGLDLNGAFGLVASKSAARRIAARLNEAIGRAHDRGGSMEQAIAESSCGDILRAYWRGRRVWDANETLASTGCWPC